MKTKKSKVALFGGYELGKTYFNNYWRQKVTVKQLHGDGTPSNWMVTVVWEDGRETTHCTIRDKRDREVI